MTLTVIHTAICAALFWSCFCRLVRTDDNTYPAVRLGFAALGAGALASTVAPWLWGTHANWPSTGLAAGMLLAQGVTARFWRDGVPPHFQKETPSCGS